VNWTLLKKCLQESKWLLLGCSFVMVAFCWIRVWIVSRVDTERFKAILDLLPSDFERFSTVSFDWLITYAGRISLTYDEPMVVFCVTVWAIARGSDVVSGELSRGTMEMLLAQPISRMQVLWTQTGVTLAGVGVLALASWVGIVLGVATNTVEETVQPKIWLPVIGPVPNYLAPAEKVTRPMWEKVDTTVFAPAAMSLFCLGFMLAGLSAMMSSWDRYRWRTIGLVVGFYVLSVIFKLVGMGSDPFHWLMYLSVFSAYEPEAFVRTAVVSPEQTWSLVLYNNEGNFASLGAMGYNLLLLAVGSVGYCSAAYFFQKRDLQAPL